MGDGLGSNVTLDCFEAKPRGVIYGLPRYSYVVFRSKRVDRCCLMLGMRSIWKP